MNDVPENSIILDDVPPAYMHSWRDAVKKREIPKKYETIYNGFSETKKNRQTVLFNLSGEEGI